MSGTKLHELLAVREQLRSQSAATSADLRNTFEKKRTHFSEKRVTVKSLKEDVDDKVEIQHTIQTTVGKELEWISEKIAKAIDVSHQVELANTAAKADIVLESGETLLRDIPATSLLEIEKRLVEIQTLAAAVPTLDPAQGFTIDPTMNPGTYKARDVEKPRTEKTFEFHVMVQATDKFPAQVKELNVDRPIATLITQEWSTLITVAAKGEMLDRIEELIRAVRKARARANDIEVDAKANKIGASLLAYAFTGTH